MRFGSRPPSDSPQCGSAYSALKELEPLEPAGATWLAGEDRLDQLGKLVGCSEIGWISWIGRNGWVGLVR